MELCDLGHIARVHKKGFFFIPQNRPNFGFRAPYLRVEYTLGVGRYTLYQRSGGGSSWMTVCALWSVSSSLPSPSPPLSSPDTLQIYLWSGASGSWGGCTHSWTLLPPQALMFVLSALPALFTLQGRKLIPGGRQTSAQQCVKFCPRKSLTHYPFLSPQLYCLPFPREFYLDHIFFHDCSKHAVGRASLWSYSLRTLYLRVLVILWKLTSHQIIIRTIWAVLAGCELYY